MSEAGDPTITGGDNNELLSITKDLTALTKEKDDMSCGLLRYSLSLFSLILMTTSSYNFLPHKTNPPLLPSSPEIQSLKEENGQMANYLKSLNDDLREARALAHGLKDKVCSWLWGGVLLSTNLY